MERKCVCGHLESEHEEVANVEYSGQLVCLHTDEPDKAVVNCECMNFVPAESAVPA